MLALGQGFEYIYVLYIYWLWLLLEKRHCFEDAGETDQILSKLVFWGLAYIDYVQYRFDKAFCA